jgi:hypothetical protein
MQGVIQKIEFTKNGAKKLQIGGTWYFAGKVNMEDAKVGDKIDFSFSEFGEDRGKGRLKGIQDWRPVTDATGRPETGSTISDADILRSVSNVVGNACAAGTIKGPEELEKWFVAAQRGFVNCMRPDKPSPPQSNGVDPEFNDEIPDSFYEGLPPSRTRASGTGF